MALLFSVAMWTAMNVILLLGWMFPRQILFIIAAGAVFSILIQLIPFLLISYVFPERNILRRYSSSSSWALVTGAASGIGREIASKLASQGMSLYLVDVNRRNLLSLTAGLQHQHQNLGTKFCAIFADLCNPDEAVGQIMKRIGDEKCVPSCLFLNAGYTQVGAFRTTDWKLLSDSIQCNAVASVRIAREILPMMIEEGATGRSASSPRGLVVFTSSCAALLPTAAQTTYAASKSFLTAFARSLSLEMAPHGIDVLAAHPGPLIDTQFLKKNVKGDVPKLWAFDFLSKFSTTTSAVVSTMFRAVGRAVIIDTDWFAFLVRLTLRVIDEDSALRLYRLGVRFLPQSDRSAMGLRD